MRVIEADKVAIWCVVMDDEQRQYVRHGPEHWEVRMGESMETVHHCDHLETAFQRWRAYMGVTED